MSEHNDYARDTLTAVTQNLLGHPPLTVVGKKFLFTATHGSHDFALMGTVTGIAWADESGLEVFVSTPRLWGSPLRSFMVTQNGWAARIEIDEEPYRRRIENLPDDDSPETDAKGEAISRELIRARFIYGCLTLS
ncbi:hypothetical protein FJY94_00465 [Candidatus Kaiserbacteria bacterium]|nr:hypothetical protein [Candidatus Kaiserbacteria bacterium]